MKTKKVYAAVISVKNDLFTFLDERDALVEWLQDIKKHGPGLEEFFCKLSESHKCSAPFAGFTWECTPEGFEFWQKIHKEWIDRLKSETAWYADIDEILWDWDVDIDVQKIKIPTIVGHWYLLDDCSWNRPALPEYEGPVWAGGAVTGHMNCQDEDLSKKYLILSRPVEKTVEWACGTSKRFFIKVWVPQKNQAYWFLHNPRHVF